MFEDNFFREMKRIKKNMDRAFGDFFSDRKLDLKEEVMKDYRNAFTDFDETENEFIMKVELPGMKKDDVVVDLVDGSLEIKAQKKDRKESNEDGGSYFAQSQSQFFRRIQLPEEADTEDIDASFEDGVLTVKIKKKKSKSGKEIKIN